MSKELTITLFGMINAGKSSLMNALAGERVQSVSAVGGKTVSAHRYRLSGEFQIRGEDTVLNLVDTPGISEVDGEERAVLAFDEAKRSDLILFVVTSDLSAVEQDALSQLSEANKPMLLVLNQVDRYRPEQLQEIRTAIEEKVQAYIETNNIVEVSAAPVKPRIVIGTNGEEVFEEVEDAPDIDSLKARIFKVIQNEGWALKELSSIAEKFQREVIDKRKRLSEKKESATGIIENYAVTTAVAIGVNPIPLADIAGGVVSLSAMLVHLGKHFEVDLDDNEVEELASQLWSEGKELLASVIITNVVGSLIKTIPLIGTLVGGVVQGGPAGFLVYVIGSAAAEYFANGKTWAEDGSMRSTLEHIIATTDRSAVTAKITSRMKAQLGM